MWTTELVNRLERYVWANRYFKVEYKGMEVFGMDQYPDNQSLIFLQNNAASGTVLGGTKPEDFKVFSLRPVDWANNDPDTGML